MPTIRRLRSVVAVVLLSMITSVILLATATAADAHTPSFTAMCDAQQVKTTAAASFTNYNANVTNTVKVVVDGTTVRDETFGASDVFDLDYTSYQSHRFVADVVAGDDPNGSQGYTRHYDITVPACTTPPTTPVTPAAPTVTTPSCSQPNETVTPGSQPGVVATPAVPFVLTPGQSGIVNYAPAPGYVFPTGTQTSYSFSNTFNPAVCSTPPVPKVNKFKAGLRCECITKDFGEFLATVHNYGVSSQAQRVTVKVNGVTVKRAKVAPGSTFRLPMTGVRTGALVKLYVNGNLVKHQVVPYGCKPKHVNPGGLRTTVAHRAAGG